MSKTIPSIHESFNARSLTTEELCRSFILNDYFNQLSATSNSIMIGPRGSGKTTLMRMLQVQSLEIWEHHAADRFRQEIEFSGVFIPTDRLWKEQYEKLKNTFQDDETFMSILNSSFTYHVLERLATCIEYRLNRTTKKRNNFRSVSMEKSEETQLVKELSRLWLVNPQIGSLKALEIAVTQKKHEISEYISIKLKRLPKRKGVEPNIATTPIEVILGSSIRIINIFFNQKGYKWAFLFDELELAPEHIIQPLVNSMRGGPEDILFKLSLSPYHKNVSLTSDPESSMKDHDENFINLTAAADEKGYRFAKALCEKIFEKHDLRSKPIENYFELPEQMNVGKEFRELAKKDPTFSQHLDRNKIDLTKLCDYKEADKLTLIRKIKFVVQLRNYYRKSQKMAGRRSPLYIYSGFKYICSAMEYNPRMLIGIMNSLVAHVGEQEVISISAQQKCLNESLDSFSALLQTIPIDITVGTKKLNTIYDLVEIIAEYFREEIVGERFNAEPKGTIEFRYRRSRMHKEAIGYALNAGALIEEKTVKNRSHNIFDIGNARCRLSRLFAHKFGLLLTRKPRKIELIDILDQSRKKAGQEEINHPDLFN